RAHERRSLRGEARGSAAAREREDKRPSTHHVTPYQDTNIRDCGFRIADCGFEFRAPNPQSTIRNPQLPHGFQAPLATAGTNVSSPSGGNSSVFPCSALM